MAWLAIAAGAEPTSLAYDGWGGRQHTCSYACAWVAFACALAVATMSIRQGRLIVLVRGGGGGSGGERAAMCWQGRRDRAVSQGVVQRPQHGLPTKARPGLHMQPVIRQMLLSLCATPCLSERPAYGASRQRHPRVFDRIPAFL